MEKKMMMPANYNVMNEEEMTYTAGGATIPFAQIATGAFGIAATGISIYNEICVAKVVKNFVNTHKNDDASAFVNSAVNQFTDYLSKGVMNMVIGAYSLLNQGFWWPVTGVYCLMA